MNNSRLPGIVALLCGALALTACDTQSPEPVQQTSAPKAGSYGSDADGMAAATTSYSDTVPTVAANRDNNESLLLSNTVQLITEGLRSGESYFSADGNRMIYQAENEPGNPFYQIYLRDLTSGATHRVSPGTGLATCAWIHPAQDKVIFASTHEDPNAVAKQQDEIAFRGSGAARAYAWDYDPFYEIYETDSNGGNIRNLTNARGYDAEGSYSADGSKIVFASNRKAYSRTLSQAEQKLLEHDASYFMDLYVMDADGSNVVQLTYSTGYDGGPFYNADASKIVWRRFNPDGSSAEIWIMDADGSNQRQLTADAMVSWGPYFHPSGDYIIYSSNLLGHANFELFLIDVEGGHDPVRVTNTDGTDILPVFSPEGTRLAWSSTRTADGSSQVFMADWNDQAARRLLDLE